jgi:Na+/proline symporter
MLYMLSNISTNDRNTLLKIMIFYSILTYFVFPLIGLYIKKTKEGLTHGMIVGTILSIFLWFKYGSKMVNLE